MRERLLYIMYLRYLLCTKVPIGRVAFYCTYYCTSTYVLDIGNKSRIMKCKYIPHGNLGRALTKPFIAINEKLVMLIFMPKWLVTYFCPSYEQLNRILFQVRPRFSTPRHNKSYIRNRTLVT